MQLPVCLLEVSNNFLSRCTRLEHLDLWNTSLQRFGVSFLFDCSNLTSVELPDYPMGIRLLFVMMLQA